MSFWTDAAVLGEAGIPSVLFGPEGAGLHGVDEWVDLHSVQKCRDALVTLISNVVQVERSDRSAYAFLPADPFSTNADVGRPLAEAPHEVREPLLAERHVDPHPVALGAERRLQIAPNPVEHLELVAICGDGTLPGVGS